MTIPQELLDLKIRSENAKKEFDSIKKIYRDYIVSLNNRDYQELINEINSQRITKILYKLMHFPGDVSDAMLVKLSDALELIKMKDLHDEQ